MRTTAPLSHAERVEADICPACNRHRAEEESHWNRQTFWQKWGAIFTGLAFVAAGVYAYYAFRQVDAMNKALAISEGARLAITDIRPRGLGTPVGAIVLQVRNVGRSPAQKINIFVNWCFKLDIPRRLFIFQSGPSPETAEEGELSQDEVAKVRMPVVFQGSPQEANSIPEALSKTYSPLVIHGSLKYTDRFNEPSGRKFCFDYFLADGSWNMCTKIKLPKTGPPSCYNYRY
jgi:hypothetical protein